MVNVLIVDDDIYYAKNLMNIINTKNNTVRVCNICINGKEALNIINTINDIDVIVLDLQMPIYNGMYLLNALPEEKYKESIIVISGDNELVSRLRNSKKIFTYINKLYDMEKIAEKVEELIIYKEERKTNKCIRNKITKELEYLNYNLSHKGTQYLIEVIYILIKDYNYEIVNLKKYVYPILAERYRKTSHNIKCNINNATEYMYCECNQYILNKYFNFYTDTKPSTKTVIYTILTKLIKE